MKFSASISEFNKILQKTLPAMPRKSTINVLEHLNFNLNGNTLTVVSTDQEIIIMSSIQVEGFDDGSILVPGKRLNEIMSKFDKVGSFEFSVEFQSNDIYLNTTKGKYLLKGLNTDEYVDLPQLFDSQKPEYEIVDGKPVIQSTNTNSAYFTKDEVSSFCEKTYFAVSKDEYRPAMTGVLFQFSGTVFNSVATDSFRLSKVTITKDSTVFPDDFSVIIPARAVELLKKVEADVIVSFVESFTKITHARFDYGDTVLITRIIEEKFPPYETVIPKQTNFMATVNYKEFYSALGRVATFANETTHQIRCNFEANLINIMALDEDTGMEGKETVNCDYNSNDMLIGFNHKYLDEALKVMDSELTNEFITLSFTESNKPVIIKADNENSNVLMLIMPVRLA